MPVNMDPSKKRRKTPAAAQSQEQTRRDSSHQTHARPAGSPDEPTDRDRELALADAEWKNLWDATEVIDMDRW